MKPKPGSLNRIALGCLAFSLLGFLDATYLTIQHYRGAALECAILEGCDTVTTSQYAKIGPIPIALLGALYYLSIFLTAFAYIDAKRLLFLRVIAYLSFVGVLASLILVYLQVFVIRALCLYCLFSVVASMGLCALSLVFLATRRAPADNL